MFVVTLTYVVPLEEVDAHLEEHIDYLEAQYAAGVFLASGPRVPRTGGVILARADSEAALKAVLDQDPFSRHGLADYDVVEFVARMTSPELEPIRE